MTRYVGTGEGRWITQAYPDGSYACRGYAYTPSLADVTAVNAAAEGMTKRARIMATTRGGYGKPGGALAVWTARGLLGELATGHAIGVGADLTVKQRPDHGSRDIGPFEVRTSGSYQLYGFALKGKSDGLGGWRVLAKDRGQLIVCVEYRDAGDLVVMGYAAADEVARLAPDVARELRMVAIIEPPELLPLSDLAPFYDAWKASPSWAAAWARWASTQEARA